MWVVPSSFITTITQLFILLSNFKFLTARRLPTLYWNSSNPLFTDRSRFPKDAEIGAGAAFIEVDAMDSMEIVCPSYRKRGTVDKYEQLIIHQVSDLSFMSCELDSRSQVFLTCDSPLATTPITHKIVFRQFSPLPYGFEYQPGRSYYLITTSNGSAEGMNNTRFGLCVTANMRLRIDVRPLNDEIYTKFEEEMDSQFSLESSKTIRTERKDRLRNGNVKLSRNSADESEQSANGLNNESQKFAARHGFDLTRLEYVRQLAIDGIEGDFSFLERENDSLASHKSGRGKSRMPDAHSNREEVFHSANRQAQRWISKEKQDRFGVLQDQLSKQDTDSIDSVQDYVVDDASASDTIFAQDYSLYVAVLVLLLLWIRGR